MPGPSAHPASCLWLPERAEEAAAFYLDTFRAAGLAAERRGEMRMGAGGDLVAVTLGLAGLEVMLFNPRGQEQHSHAFSLFLTLPDQAALDRIWEGLLQGGAPVACGWLKDRFGISWQIVPEPVGTLLNTADAAQAARLMQAIQGMVKLDLAALRRAFDGTA